VNEVETHGAIQEGIGYQQVTQNSKSGHGEVTLHLTTKHLNPSALSNPAAPTIAADQIPRKHNMGGTGAVYKCGRHSIVCFNMPDVGPAEFGGHVRFLGNDALEPSFEYNLRAALAGFRRL
jgi:hypothetical protein